jgi:hypothetical protein
MTKQEIGNAIKVTQAVAETIRDSTRMQGYAIEGHLYAALSTIGLSLEHFNALVGILVNGKLVQRNGDHTLTWIGPVV